MLMAGLNLKWKKTEMKVENCRFPVGVCKTVRFLVKSGVLKPHRPCQEHVLGFVFINVFILFLNQ